MLSSGDFARRQSVLWAEKEGLDNERNLSDWRSLTMKSEEDIWFVQSIDEELIPKLKIGRIDYDLMQLNRLLSKQTLRELDEHDIKISNSYWQVVKDMVTGAMLELLKDLYFYTEAENKKEDILLIRQRQVDLIL